MTLTGKDLLSIRPILRENVVLFVCFLFKINGLYIIILLVQDRGQSVEHCIVFSEDLRTGKLRSTILFLVRLSYDHILV